MLEIFIVVILFILYTSILDKILFPYGKRAFGIIHKLSKKEFGKYMDGCENYVDLKKRIISNLKKMKEQEFEENVLSTLVGIEHIKENDFGSYMAIKFAYWAIILATVSNVYQGSLFDFFGLNKLISLCIVMIIFTIFLLIMGNKIRRQHNSLEYLNFKLICINVVKAEKEKQVQNENMKKRNKNCKPEFYQ